MFWEGTEERPQRKRPMRRKAVSRLKAAAAPRKPRPAPPKERRAELSTLVAGGGRLVKAGRGGTRIFLEGLWIARSGFEAFGEATIVFDPKRRRVTLLLDPDAAQALSSDDSSEIVRKKISGKIKRGEKVPVIDIERQDLSEILGGASELVVQLGRRQLVITPAESKAALEERLQAAPNNSEVDLYAGAGLLALAGELAGARSVAAIEKWDRAAEAFWLAHGKQVPVLEVAVEEAAMGQLRDPGLFNLPKNPWLVTAGVPCEPYSRLGGKGIEAESPHELADQIYWTLAYVLASNPQNVLVENVPEFLKFSGGFVRALQVLGYHVHVALLSPSDFGWTARRPRAVLVATTAPGFEFPKSVPGPRQHVRGVLLPPDTPVLYQLDARQGGWFSVEDGRKNFDAWVKAGKPLGEGGKRPREYTGIATDVWSWLHGFDAKGQKRKSFGRRAAELAVVEYVDDVIPAISRNYYRVSPTGPYVRHPKKRDLYRMLTVEEIARIQDVPDAYARRLPGQDDYALATQLYGQGVHVGLFTEIVRRIPRGSSREIVTAGRRLKNPFQVVPLWYGQGPLYSVIPWAQIAGNPDPTPEEIADAEAWTRQFMAKKKVAAKEARAARRRGEVPWYETPEAKEAWRRQDEAHQQQMAERYAAKAAMPPRRICLVGCAKEKRPGAAPAKDLYTSSLFRKARHYAETKCDAWVILSAKHGVLLPDQVVEPYDMRCEQLRLRERDAWGTRIGSRLEDLFGPNDTFVGLAGRCYLDALPQKIRQRTEEPLAGLQVGERLRWFKEQR